MDETITKNDEGTVVVNETTQKVQKGDTRSLRIKTAEDAVIISEEMEKYHMTFTDVVLYAVRNLHQEDAFPTSHENERNQIRNYLKTLEAFLMNLVQQWDGERDQTRQEFANELDRQKKHIDMLATEKNSLQMQVAALTKSLESAATEREHAVQDNNSLRILSQDLSRQLEDHNDELAAAREIRAKYEEVRRDLEAATTRIAVLNGKLEVYTAK